MLTKLGLSGNVWVEIEESARKTRAQPAEALEVWADSVETADLKEADSVALRVIAGLTEERDRLNERLTEAVRSARNAHWSWSEIGAMLGVSKQAAQRKYGPKVSAHHRAGGAATGRVRPGDAVRASTRQSPRAGRGCS